MLRRFFSTAPARITKPHGWIFHTNALVGKFGGLETNILKNQFRKKGIELADSALQKEIASNHTHLSIVDNLLRANRKTQQMSQQFLRERNEIYAGFLVDASNQLESQFHIDPLKKLEKRGMKIAIASDFPEVLTKKLVESSPVKISAWSTHNTLLGERAELSQFLAILRNPFFSYPNTRDPRGIILVSSTLTGISKTFQEQLKQQFNISCWTIWDLKRSPLLNPRHPSQVDHDMFLQWQREHLIRDHISDKFQPDYVRTSDGFELFEKEIRARLLQGSQPGDSPTLVERGGVLSEHRGFVAGLGRP